MHAWCELDLGNISQGGAAGGLDDVWRVLQVKDTGTRARVLVSIPPRLNGM